MNRCSFISNLTMLPARVRNSIFFYRGLAYTSLLSLKFSKAYNCCSFIDVDSPSGPMSLSFSTATKGQFQQERWKILSCLDDLGNIWKSGKSGFKSSQSEGSHRTPGHPSLGQQLLNIKTNLTVWQWGEGRRGASGTAVLGSNFMEWHKNSH